MIHLTAGSTQTATYHVNFPTGAALGQSAVIADSGVLSHTATAHYEAVAQQMGDFTIKLYNASLDKRATVATENSASNPLRADNGDGIQVVVTSVNGFAGDVVLTKASNPSGYSTGTFSPATVHVPAGGSANSTFAVGFVAPPTGEVSQIVTGTSGGITHPVTAVYDGGSFTITLLNDHSNQGASATRGTFVVQNGPGTPLTNPFPARILVQVDSLHLWQGDVTLAVSNTTRFFGVSTPSPVKVHVASGGSATAAITVNPDLSATTPGQSTVTGTGGGSVQTKTAYYLYVNGG